MQFITLEGGKAVFHPELLVNMVLHIVCQCWVSLTILLIAYLGFNWIGRIIKGAEYANKQRAKARRDLAYLENKDRIDAKYGWGKK